MYTTEKIDNPAQKKNYVNEVLLTLPEWFGNSQANKKYALEVMSLPFFSVFDHEKKTIGFIATKIHHKRTGEIFLIGIKPEYHGNGIGKILVNIIENYCVENGCSRMLVKTLSDESNYAPYKKTKEFYRSLDYEELITFDEFWDNENKCLLMLKDL